MIIKGLNGQEYFARGNKIGNLLKLAISYHENEYNFRRLRYYNNNFKARMTQIVEQPINPAIED